jgi:hypothetical protein
MIRRMTVVCSVESAGMASMLTDLWLDTDRGPEALVELLDHEDT